MRVKCFLAATLVAVLSWVLFAGVAGTTPTQEEFDEIVDREMFKYMHGWDYIGAVNYWKSKGVTDGMFGRAYAKVARKTLHSLEEKGSKCYRAIDGVARFCTGEEQLTNLLYFAEHVAADNVRAHAIWVLSNKTTPVYFAAFAERVVASTNLGYHAASELMSCLSESYKKLDSRNTVWRTRILQTMRRHLEVGGKGFAIADHALVRHDSTYANSEFRREMALRLLDPQRSPLNGTKRIDRGRIEGELRKVLRKGNAR